MKILKNNKTINILAKVAEYKKLLSEKKIVKLYSDDHIVVLSAFIAWLESSGNLAIIHPSLPTQQIKNLENQLDKIELNNEIVFHTSGTTSQPKIIKQSKEFIENLVNNKKHLTGWNAETGFLNILPAATSGFVHIVAASTYFTDSTIILSDKKNLYDDICSDRSTLTILVPNVIDQLKSSGSRLPLDLLERVCIGASPFTDQQSKWLFGQKTNKISHIYGTTETGSPILGRTDTKYNEKNTWLTTDKHCVLEEGELIYKGHRTGDLFIKQGKEIKFLGRTNDIVTINGYQSNLLVIEQAIESLYGITECEAVPRNLNGTDYIELVYASNLTINKNEAKQKLKPILPECNIPVKYTKTNQINRNQWGKKVRSVG